MEALQDFLTIAATIMEYVIFGYVVVTSMLFAFQQQRLENLQRESLAVSHQKDVVSSRQQPVTIPSPEDNPLLAPA